MSHESSLLDSAVAFCVSAGWWFDGLETGGVVCRPPGGSAECVVRVVEDGVYAAVIAESRLDLDVPAPPPGVVEGYCLAASERSAAGVFLPGGGSSIRLRSTLLVPALHPGAGALIAPLLVFNVEGMARHAAAFGAVVSGEATVPDALDSLLQGPGDR